MNNGEDRTGPQQNSKMLNPTGLAPGGGAGQGASSSQASQVSCHQAVTKLSQLSPQGLMTGQQGQGLVSQVAAATHAQSQVPGPAAVQGSTSWAAAAGKVFFVISFLIFFNYFPSGSAPYREH